MLDAKSIPLAPYERGEKTRAEMAAELGVTERHLRRLLARDRMEIEQPCESDLPWVELVDGREPPTPHYDLATDRLVKPAGAFRIGDGRGRLRVRRAGDGQPLDTRPEKPPPKFQPKRPKRKKQTA